MHRQRLQPAAPVGQGDRPVAVAVPHGMKPAPFAYHRPARLDEALALLNRLGGEARPLAGGQSLVPMMNMRVARPEHLVDLNEPLTLGRFVRSPDA